MEGLKEKKYLQTRRKPFDPIALLLSTVGLLGVLFVVGGMESTDYFMDIRSIAVVIGGTFASMLFQFDFSSTLSSIVITIKSFVGTPEKKVLGVIRELDDAILNDTPLSELREAEEINGEMLNDIVYMHRQGLLFDEIDEFITARVKDEFFGREIAVAMLNRASIIAPALGLFGTVMGLIGVLKSLSSPTQIGPSMSLALMTTAYGAGLGSLVFTPLSGRIDHHNQIFLEVHKQLLSRVGLVLKREERRLMSRGNQAV